MIFDQFTAAKFLRIMNSTFKMIQESVRHALIKVLHTLRQLFSTEILQIRTKTICLLKWLTSKSSCGQVTLVLTFLFPMLSMKPRLCLWISLPGFCKVLRNSTKSCDTRSVSMLDWRVMEGLGVFPSWLSEEHKCTECLQIGCMNIQ